MTLYRPILIRMMDCRHPSIVKIKENTLDKALFDFESITSWDVEKIINGFDSKKAHGYDKMPMKLLQKCAQHIAPDIAKLINNSFSKCVFPDDLKFAEVSSLFKKYDALNKSNYRPVSILIALSKIYQKALSIQAAEHLTRYFRPYFPLFEKDIIANQHC